MAAAVAEAGAAAARATIEEVFFRGAIVVDATATLPLASKTVRAGKTKAAASAQANLQRVSSEVVSAVSSRRSLHLTQP
jgi:hypothetical protein